MTSDDQATALAALANRIFNSGEQGPTRLAVTTSPNDEEQAKISLAQQIFNTNQDQE